MTRIKPVKVESLYEDLGEKERLFLRQGTVPRGKSRSELIQSVADSAVAGGGKNFARLCCAAPTRARQRFSRKVPTRHGRTLIVRGTRRSSLFDRIRLSQTVKRLAVTFAQCVLLLIEWIGPIQTGGLTMRSS